ncbi:MAG TPA: TROVE domain-containing protein [Phycisphaerae bacterium]|nr:TROVE domain-containing protein [Phycisphaerae bacterium]HRW53916.1 TROVE domain-containing protein [Phycisphaerae bacterium]
MASKGLFRSFRGSKAPATDTINEAGGHAYRFNAKHALAQYAATGCLNGTFYASANTQLKTVLALCAKVEPEFIARTALYARSHGHMKDMPALLCAILSVKGPGLLAEVFDRVIDSPKMLRNFVQIMRSGATGRKSLGSLPKRLILNWIEARSDEQLFIGSIGNDPSMADVIRMVHPKPKSASREAMFGYLIGRDHDANALPDIVKRYERFKNNADPAVVPIPNVPFQMLTSLALTKDAWKSIANNAPWQMTRMNLNTFERHGVFKDKKLTARIARRLRNPALIERARVFPYQLLVAYSNASAQIPHNVREALQDAMEIATNNVPKIEGKAFVFPDISGSMHSPITGLRKGSTTAVRCIDVAALVAAALMRTNPQTEVVPFESKAIPPERVRLNPRDSVMTNARLLANLPAGGTNCSAPLKLLNQRKAIGDLVIYVSDNESWVDSPNYGWMGGSATQTMNEWREFRQRNPKARMVCIDIQPYGTTQAQERDDIINVGGFSDQVFNLIGAISRGEALSGYFVRRIEAMRL